jgi:hypothetical protein
MNIPPTSTHASQESFHRVEKSAITLTYDTQVLLNLPVIYEKLHNIYKT